LKRFKDKILEALVTNYLEQDENLFNIPWLKFEKNKNLSISDNTLKKQYEEKFQKSKNRKKLKDKELSSYLFLFLKGKSYNCIHSSI
jgi:uncharacterized protein (UPF0297 family)